MSESQSLTILFADVSGSTKLFETRGDFEARRLVAAILNALSEVAAQHGGRVIKTIGDEVMCTFPGAMQGLLGSVDMQKRISHDAAFAKDNLAVRIGLHHGDALVEDNDVFGDAVNTAARMAALAKREQIITTASTVRMLTNSGCAHARSAGRALPASKSDRYR
jgi:class 3 adenylate cyclase